MVGQLSQKPLFTFEGQPQFEEGTSKDDGSMARLQNVVRLCFAPRNQASGESKVDKSV